MVYLPPPHLATPSRPSYAEAYAQILTAHRSSPLTSASSVIIVCAANVDALCAARMLVDLFKQDDVMHRIIPVGGYYELGEVRNSLKEYSEVRAISPTLGISNN
jgi:cell division control protein 45